MKFTAVLLFALFAIQATVAHPEPFFSKFADLTKKLGDAAQGVIDGSTGAVTGGMDAVHGAVKGGIEAGANVAKGVVGGASGVVSGGLNAFGSVEDQLKNSIGGFTSNIVKRAASAFQSQVKLLQQGAEKVLQTADEVTTGIRDNVDALTQKAKDGLNSFAASLQNKAARAPANSQSRIQELIDQFVDESSEKIDECANGLLAPVEDLNERVRDTVQDSFPLIDEVLQAIRDCAELNQRDYKAVTSCANDIKNKALALKSLPTQYANLLKQLAQAGSSTVTRSPCVVSVTADLIQKRSELSAQISKLL